MSVERFAGYVATLGRGPGRSRALTREESRDAMGILLAGDADPVQVGAFLMLLRYRGEDTNEIAGLVEGAVPATRLPGAVADLDWPSYGAGRTRGAPWFLLAALALADAGFRIFMHGTNEFTGGITVSEALIRLGRAPAETVPDGQRQLAQTGFSYMPIGVLCPALAYLLGLRRLLGLRSPMNTVARLLDPAGAPAAVDGVFHPPYIETHLAAAELLGRPSLLVLKGGGGEAERNPAKPVSVHLWRAGEGRREVVLPALYGLGEPETTPEISAVWRGDAHAPFVEAKIVATIELALLAMRAKAEPAKIWSNRSQN
jgi:anthranilate phosphoribosyltransferase